MPGFRAKLAGVDMATYPKGSIMIVHYEELASQEAMRQIYNEFLWPMPPIEGVVWYYPKLDMIELDMMAFAEPPQFHIQTFGRAERFSKPPEVELAYPIEKPRNRKPQQPRFRPKDHYRK